MEKHNEKVTYTATSCIANEINNWKLYDYEKSLYKYDWDIDSKFVTKHAKWGDHKSIYDINDEKFTSSSCW